MKRWLWLLLACVVGGFLFGGPRADKTAALSAGSDPAILSTEEMAPEAVSRHPVGSNVLGVARHLGEWVSRGPKNYGGKVHDLAVDPTDENIVYAAYGCYSDLHSTNGTGSGLWRSRNGGNSWQPLISAAEDPCVLSVDVHPAQPDLVVAGLRGSPLNLHPGDVRLSRDGGESWVSIGPPSAKAPPLHVFAVKFDIVDPDTIYAATHQGLFKTANAGQDWTKVLDYSGSGFWPDAPSLARHPTDRNTLLLAVRTLGIQRTGDGGNTWDRVDGKMDQSEPITVLAWARTNPNIVYAERISPVRDSAGHHIQMFTYRSDDAGLSWTPTTVINARHQSRYDMSIAVDPGDENRVIVGNSSMVYSTDGLRTTRSSPRAPHADQLMTVFAISNPNVVYNGNDGGLWKSIDRGVTWKRADQGVLTNHVSSFAVYPKTGVINLSAADYGAIAYDPQDPQGNGWHNSDCGNEYRSNYINPNDPERAYYGGGGTTPLTLVGNASRDCQDIDPAPPESRAGHIPMAFDPNDSNVIYAGLGHVWKSADGGATWRSIGIEEVFQAGRHINTFLVAPSDGATLYAFTNQNGNLWATHDGGASWTAVSNFASPRALAVMPKDSKAVYVGTDLGTDARHGLFRSNDGGVTFEQLSAFPSNLPINKIIIDPLLPDRLFVATGTGVLLTEDGGGSWAQLGGEMPRGIVVDESLVGRTLYASTDQGIWSIDLNGKPACEQPITLLPKQVILGSSGGRAELDISIASSCPWEADVGADWVEIEAPAKRRGPALIDLIVHSNLGGTRETVLSVAGQKIPVKQLGGPDPIAPDAVITVSIAGECLTLGSGDILEFQTCREGDLNQGFRLEAMRPLLYHLISVAAPNSCLDTRKTRVAGTRLHQGTCSGDGDAHQFFEPLPDEAGWRLRGNLSGRTPGPEGHTLMCQEKNGNHLEQQLCSGSELQRFQISRIE